MEKKTIEIIALCKNWGQDGTGLTRDERISAYLREYYSTSYHYTYSDITKELRRAAIDYIKTCDDPRKEFSRYLYCREYLFDYEYRPEHDILMMFLSETQVKNEGEYINGFYDIQLWHEDDE